MGSSGSDSGKPGKHILSRIVLFLIALYQKSLSPDRGVLSPRLRGRICCHTPHCSEYAKVCFERYGFIQALNMSIERVSQCTGGSSVVYDPPSYRVVFFSSAEIGVPYLTALHEDLRYDVVGVVTMPDAPAGRGYTLRENIIKSTAASYSIDVITPPSLRKNSKKWKEEATVFHHRLEEKAPDFLVVLAYGKIIPQDVLDIPRLLPINVHGSLLPAWRGASPIQSVFLAGEAESGITIMRMVAELDAGDILSHDRVALPFERTSRELLGRMKEAGPSLLLRTLWEYGKFDLEPIPQDPSRVTYCYKIQKEDGAIVPREDSIETIYAKWRAYTLRPQLYFFLGEKRIKIEGLMLEESLYSQAKTRPLFFPEGEKIILHPAVQQLTLKPEGKKALSRDDFLRGYAGLIRETLIP